MPGWDATVVTSKLAKPVTTDDGQITEAVSQITWTATGVGIPPHQFGLFTVSVGQLPANTGKLASKPSRPTATAPSSVGSKFR